MTASNAVSGSNNPVNNFFGSQVNTLLPLVTPAGSSIITPTGSSLLDTRGSYGLNNFPTSGGFPNNFGRQGWDITSVDVSNQVNYNQTVAYAQGTTTGDDYTINSLALAISVGAPILNFEKTVNNQKSIVLDGTALPTNVTFELTITNTGTADASSITFTDPLQTGLTYIPGSATLNGGSCRGSFLLAWEHLELVKVLQSPLKQLSPPIRLLVNLFTLMPAFWITNFSHAEKPY